MANAIGVIGVSRSEAGAFAANDVELLQTFADQAVIAIENVRLFNETKEALERQTATADILKVIASSPSDVQPVFEAIVASANAAAWRVLDGGFSRLSTEYGSSRRVHCRQAPAADESVDKAAFPHAASPTFRRVSTGARLVELPCRSPTPNSRLSGSRRSRGRGFRSMLFVPLMSKRSTDRRASALPRTRKPVSFGDHHVQLLQTFADQAVIAIENVRLFNEVKERTDDLSEVAAAADRHRRRAQGDQPLGVRSADRAANARRICGSIMRGGAGKYLAAEGDQPYHLAASFGVSSKYKEQSENVRYLGSIGLVPGRGSIVGRALLERKTVQIPDVQNDPEYELSEVVRIGDYRTLLAVPLLREGVPIGVIVLIRCTVQPFTDKQIELVTTFADQAVIAIENTPAVQRSEGAHRRSERIAAAADGDCRCVEGY